MAELSVVLIQLDSLSRHFLPCYGNRWVQTPTLDAFARRAAVFDRHFAGSLPCMPARREIWCGVEELWWRGWGPLEPWDEPIAHRCRRSGRPIVTQLITDHYHLFEWGAHSYHHDFHGYECIRGHEMDNWRTEPLAAVPDWAAVMAARRPPESAVYLRNVQGVAGEEAFFGPRVMREAAGWLDRNHAHGQFFLHVDSFDVHEPFHIPEPYRSLYTDDDYRRYSPWPHYGRTDAGDSAISPAELAWVRAQFAGKLTMLDRWLGELFERLDRHGLWERTCVIVTTDHGHYLGEHGWIGKPHAPLYHTLCHLPLLVWHPALGRDAALALGSSHDAHGADEPGPDLAARAAGRRVDAVTQTVDLYATVLDLLGVEAPASPQAHSRSLAPLLRGEAFEHRPHAVYGYNNKRVGITAGDWTLLRYHDPDAAPPCIYTHNVQQGLAFGMGQRDARALRFPEIEAGRFIPGLDTPVWRVPLFADHARRQPDPGGSLLFHNLSDPAQERDLSAARPDQLRHMERLLHDHARALGAPEEQLQRLRLP
jgi:arylsulfatase A-like enzyme